MCVKGQRRIVKNWLAGCDWKPITHVFFANLTCPVIMVIFWTIELYCTGLRVRVGESLSKVVAIWANFYISATTGVLISQGLFRPCRRKASPESYYAYFSIALCIFRTNSGELGEYDLYFHSIIWWPCQNTNTSNCSLIISSYTLKHNCRMY